MASEIDEKKKQHYQMLAKLLDYLYPKHENYPKFIVLLNSYISPANIEVAKTNVNAAFEALESTGKLAVGKYDVLKELTKDVDVKIINIIEECEKNIKAKNESDYCNDLKKTVISDNTEPICVIFDFIANAVPIDTSRLGTLLGLKHYEVERIKEEYPSLPLEQNFQVLWRWYNQTTENVQKIDHFHILKEILTEMDRNDVIVDLKTFSRSSFSYTCEKDGDKHFTEKDCLFASQRITRDAPRLMRFLDLTQANIEHIKMDYHRDVKEQTFNMLVTWRKKAFPNCTRNKLCSGLKYIKREDIIRDLEERWSKS